MQATYTIPVSNLASVEKIVAKLNKRAAKLDLTPIVLTVGESARVPLAQTSILASGPGTRLLDVVTITVDGEAPKLAGWTFVATIEHTEAGNILRSVPGYSESLPAVYRTSDPDCDHCQLVRRRNDTYIVRHEVGQFKRVGRTCLADFLGHSDPHAAAEYALCLISLGDTLTEMSGRDSWGETGGTLYAELSEVLAFSAAAIRVSGWISRASVADTGRACTADIVSTCLWPPKAAYETSEAQADRRRYDPTDADQAMATGAATWASEISPATDQDYLWNLRTLAGANGIGSRQLGLAVSIVSAYQRAVGREVERAQATATSAWFGEIGKRATYTLTLIAERSIETQYGLTRIMSFVDAAGNRAKWFASTAPGWAIGETVHVLGTVKKHDEYRGVRETVLTRCKGQ